jgi:hypothetical protein
MGYDFIVIEEGATTVDEVVIVVDSGLSVAVPMLSSMAFGAHWKH